MANITLTLYWNLDDRRWTSDLLGTTEQGPITGLVQGDTVVLNVRFVQSGAAVTLTAPVFTASSIKASGDFTGSYLIQLSAPTGSPPLYTFTVSPLNSANLNTFLQTYRNTWAVLEIYDSANGILTTPLTLEITPGYSLSGTPTDNAPGTLVVAAGKTVTFPLTLTFPSAAGTNGQQLTLSNSTTGLLEWAASGSSGDVVGPASATDSAIARFDGTTGKLVQNSAATIADTTGDITAGTYNGVTIAGSGAVNLNNGSITISGNSPINTGGGTGYINTVGGSGYINTSSELGFNGGHINTQGGTSAVGGYIRTHAGVLGTGIGAAGGNINTSNGGGNIDTTAGGSIITGAGALTGPAGGGTIATNETISGGTLAGSFTTLAASGVTSVTDTTEATSTTAASLKTAGGLGVAKNIYAGGVINIPVTTSSVGQITQAGSKILHTYGTRNVWLGLDAGNFTTTGADCIGIGNNAGLSLAAGASNNMLIGANSGAYMTTGYSNVCIGISTGYALAGGKENVAIGYASMQNGSSGGNNVGIGFAAFQNIGAATQNVAIGSHSGNSTATVGGIAGVNITTGDFNTLIGANAAVTLGDAQYRTAIGADSRSTANNQIMLGRAADIVTLPGALNAVPDTRTGAGAISITTVTTEVTTTGVADALTLADGTVGQFKIVTHKAGAFTSVLSPTTTLGFTSITFLASLGQTATLQYTSAGWVVIAVGGNPPPVVA